MTREEALAYIHEWLKDEYALNSKDREALDMAIEALELVTSYEDTINKLTEAIANTQEPKWIPVSERLPDKLNDVLITFYDCPNEYDVAYLRTTFNESYKKSGAKNEWVSSMGETTYADYEVDAWMLIQPYKAESEDKGMAIKALEQEPCEDCISRETARRIVDSGRTRQQMIDMILATPPVTSQPKTGHWIYKNGIRYCEFCGASNSTAYASYCPNCGAKMESEE